MDYGLTSISVIDKYRCFLGFLFNIIKFIYNYSGGIMIISNL